MVVAGSGSNTCSAAGACSQTQSGAPPAGSCGPYSANITCSCSNECCPSTCTSGVACGNTQVVNGCNSQAPTQKPTISSVRQPDGSATIQTRFVTVNWTFASGNNTCGSPWGFNCPSTGGDKRSFHLVIADNNSFSNPAVDVSGISQSSTSYTTTSTDGALTANTTYYVKVCAANYTENCSTTTTFIKQAITTKSFTCSTVGEYDPSSGTPFTSGGASGNTLTGFTYTAGDMDGVNSSCSVNTSGSNPVLITGCSCLVSFDNQNNDPNPNQDFTLTPVRFNSQLYSGVCTQSGGSCSGPVVVTNGNGSAAVYFAIAQGSSHFKLKNAIYQTKSEINSPFPASALPYDTDDTDGSYLIIGDSAASFGAVGSSLSAQSLNLGSAALSRKNWGSGTYTAASSLSASRFADYVRSRKEYATITDLANLSTSKVNVINGNLVIDDTNKGIFDNRNLILLVNGTITFGTGEFNPTGGSTAFVAQQITMYKDTTFLTEGHGIFLADSIDLGSSDVPLKIVGNMSSTGTAVSTGARRRADGRKPSLFVVFDPKVYIDLLPYFSVDAYEWREVR